FSLLFLFPSRSHPPLPPCSPYSTLFRSTAAETSRPVAPRIAVRLFAGAAAAFGADATTVHAATLEEVIAVLRRDGSAEAGRSPRSEEHTSELQSRFDLVCRLLLEKKN